MKLHSQEREVARKGVGSESKFKIAANAQAFDILSSKLYTDPKLAIVRELSTNAYDAQVEAGTHELPFLVHLPNDFEPWFSIRDFGTGLSPEAVESIYTTYFASTRNDSDDYTGALGLGSKSPFSYTDQFTVTSYYAGRAYTYSAFKAESGEPSIALMSDNPSTEQHGVEIRINVRPNDFWDFSRAARKVYRFFPVRPTFTGRKIEFAETVQPTYFGDEFALFESDPITLEVPGRINVVMGNICYVVNSDKIKSNLGRAATLVMFVPIGECQIAASREELHYDPTTIAKIQARIDAITADLQKRIDGELSSCKTLIERMIKLNEYRHLIDLSYANVIIKTQKDNVYKLRRVEIKGDKLFVGADRWHEDMDPNSVSFFIENDVGELSQKDKNRIRFLISGVRDAAHAKGQSSPSRFWLADIQDRTEFTKIFGEIPAVLSKLPDPPRNRNGRVTTATRSFIREFTGNYNLSEAWKSIVLAEDETVDNTQIIAVPRKGNYAIFNGRTVQPSEVWRIAEDMGYAGVYGITERYYAKIREELGLADLTEEAKAWTTNMAAKITPGEIARHAHGSIVYDYSENFLDAIKGLSAVCNDLVNAAESAEKPRTFWALAIEFGVPIPKATDPRDAFRRRYPLISQINWTYAKVADAVEYIVLREAKLAAEEAAQNAA